MADDLSRIPEVGPVRPAPIQNLSTLRAALTLCLLYCSDTVLQYLFRHWTTSFHIVKLILTVAEFTALSNKSLQGK